MFVLDTDHLTIVQQQSTPAYEYVLQRVHQHAPAAFFVSIISFHEQVMGWNAYLSQGRRLESRERKGENKCCGELSLPRSPA